MSSQRDIKQVIPGGVQEISWHHMIPIVEFLIERGHLPINYRNKSGFGATRRGMKCSLGRVITQEDWVAVKDAFILPDNIGYHQGIIRDAANWVDIIGYDEVQCEDGAQPVAVWEERERQAGRL